MVVWGLSGLLRSFSGFTPYDDEGSVLLPIAEFVGGGRLYDEVQAQYGPFFYVYKWALHRLFAIPVTHDFGRLHTWVCWTAAALLLSASMWRVTRSLPIAASVYALCSAHMYYLAREPGHPQDLVAVLVACCLYLAAIAPTSNNPSLLSASLGACTGALLGTKPNVGAFVFLSLLLWILASLTPRLSTRWIMGAIAAGVCVLPFALVRLHLHKAWPYATLVSFSILSVAWLASGLRAPRLFSSGHVAVFILSAAACVGAALLSIHSMGTTWRGCIDGLLLQHLSFGSAFSLLPLIQAHKVLLCWLATVTALSWGWIRRRQPAHAGAGTGRTLSLARLVFGVGAIETAILWPDRANGHAIYLALPWLWLVLPTPQEQQERPASSLTRFAPCALGVLLVLQAYPVHGSQADAAWLFMLPALSLCAHDGWTGLARRWVTRRPMASAASCTCLLLTCIAGTFSSWRAWELYQSLVPLSLPGARWVRTSASDARALAFVTTNLSERFDTFVTMPGLGSLYLWTAAPPPTTITTGAWVVMAAPELQQQLVNRLELMGNVGVVRNDALARFWTRGRPVPRRPLVQWIEREFTPVARVGQYEIMARRGEPVSDRGHSTRSGPTVGAGRTPPP